MYVLRFHFVGRDGTVFYRRFWNGGLDGFSWYKGNVRIDGNYRGIPPHEWAIKESTR